MKDQPWDLNQTWPVGWKWCRFTNTLNKFRGPLPLILGAKISNFGPLIPRLPHSTPHISGTKRRIDKLKRHCQSTLYSLTDHLLSVTFDPETAEIRLLIVTQHLAAIIRCNHQSCDISRFYLPHSYSIYSMRQIIKSFCVCACVCVCPSVDTLRVAFLRRFSPNWTQTCKPAKVRRSSLGVNIVPPIPPFPS